MTLGKAITGTAIASALMAAFIVVAPMQSAQAQRTSLSGIDRKVDDIQDSIGPVPVDPSQSLQQRLERVENLLQSLTSKTVFVTSTTHAGNLGGLAGADAICNARAGAAGLPGFYRAWLSDSNESARDRFQQSNFKYVLVDGTKVADNFADLTDSSLDHAIDLNEVGAAANSSVWTGTLPDGTTFPQGQGGNLCNDWRSGQAADESVIGFSNLTNSGWSGVGAVGCDRDVSLYCFQQ